MLQSNLSAGTSQNPSSWHGDLLEFLKLFRADNMGPVAVALMGDNRLGRSSIIDFAALKNDGSSMAKNELARWEGRQRDIAIADESHLQILVVPDNTHSRGDWGPAFIKFMVSTGLVQYNGGIIVTMSPALGADADLSFLDSNSIPYTVAYDATETFAATYDPDLIICHPHASRKKLFEFAGDVPSLLATYPDVLRLACDLHAIRSIRSQFSYNYDRMSPEDGADLMGALSYGQLSINMPGYLNGTRKMPGLKDPHETIMLLAASLESVDIKNLLQDPQFAFAATEVADVKAVSDLWNGFLDDYQVSLKASISSFFRRAVPESSHPYKGVRRLGTALGIEAAINAYFQGVPVEDLLV